MGEYMTEEVSGTQPPMQVKTVQDNIPDQARLQDKDKLKLGATVVKDANGKVLGTNFAVYTHPQATYAYVCLFDAEGKEQRIPLLEYKVHEKFMDNVTPCDGVIWHGFIPEAGAGQKYGFRVDGDFAPSQGKTFHVNRLLIDPYAKEVDGYPEKVMIDSPYLNGMRNTSLLNYDLNRNPNDPEDAYQKSKFRIPTEDTAPNVPKGIVVDMDKVRLNVSKRLGANDASAMKFAGTPLFHSRDASILETHVREATLLFDDIPEKYRGTYQGLASDEFIAWFKKQGYTTLELMPVHVDDASTHWGYMTTNFFSPNPKYASRDPKDGTVTEQFTEMVQKLREHGIETWIDVVFNHTAEGNHLGQVTSFKGLDERYYRKHDDTSKYLGEHYYDTTACGNTTNTDHPRFRDIIIDSLAHFRSLGVAGVRFDLMKALGRSGIKGNKHDIGHRFYKDIYDEMQPGGRLEGLKVSGEPWDLAFKDGEDTSLPQWVMEWDGGDRQIFRSASRLREGISIKTLASVIAGVGHNVKYSVSHDGYSAADALATNHWNGNEDMALDCTENEEWRIRRQTFGIALEALSQGTVLRKMGSDRGHSQGGDHNPYRNEEATSISWGDRLNPGQHRIMDFSGEAMRFKNAHPSLRRTKEFRGQDPNYKILSEHGDASICWRSTNGDGDPNWDNPHEKAFTFVLSGETGRKMPNGDPVRDTPVMGMINGSPCKVTMKIPGQSHIEGKPVNWKIAFDSSGKHSKQETQAKLYYAGETLTLPPFTAIAFEANEFPGKEHVNAQPVTRFMDTVVNARTQETAAQAPSAAR